MAVGGVIGSIFNILSYYLAYTLYLIFDATAHGALSTFRMAMLAFVIPVTAVTLLVVALRAVGANRRGNTELDGPGKRSTTR